MMYSHGNGAAWTVIGVALVLILATAVAGLLLTWSRRDPQEPPPADPMPDAERLLADRFARGEIETEEYERRLHVLRGTRR